MQPRLIALDALERSDSRGWAGLQTLLEAVAMALTRCPAASREDPGRKF